MNYEIHELAEVIPPMTDQEFAELKAGIEQKGYLPDEPVVIFEGKILDGRHRYKACGEIGIQAPTRLFEGTEEDAKNYVISKNLDRRHLTTGQRGVAALRLLDYEGAEAKKRQAEGGRKAAPGRPAESYPQQGGTLEGRHSKEATAKAGERLGVKRTTVERVRRAAKERPDLLPKIESGELTPAAAERIVLGKPSPPPKPLDTSNQRNRQVAEKAKERMQNLVSRLEGFANGAPNIRLDHVFAVASTDDLRYWHSSLSSSRNDLLQLQKDIKQEVDRRGTP